MRNFFNNIICPLGPDKRFRILIITANVFFYGSYQFRDTPERLPDESFSV